MFYREYQPCAALADFVKCFWIMEATHNPFQGKEALIPGGLRPFVRFSIAEVTNQTVDLDLIFGSQVKELECKLFEERSHKKKIAILQQALLRFLTAPDLNPPIINAAVKLIQQYHGNISVDGLARELRVNYKYLERNFLQVVGLTPKLYNRVARFQHVMQALRYAAFHAWPSLALDCGYYDQAHFIKEFKAFTGATPSEFIARQNQIAEMLTTPGNV